MAAHAPSPPADPFDGLNPTQREAAVHGLAGTGSASTAGPLLVIAGAGTGKTFTLAARVAQLVMAGADPQRLLLITFSRRAARELERRVGRMLHQALRLSPTQAPPPLPWSGTFHGVGARLLREHALQLGLAPDFSILDRGDAEDLMGQARHTLALDGSKSRFPMPATCLAIYSRTLNSRESLATVLRQVYPWCAAWADDLRRLFGAYTELKRHQWLLDYDDLLLHWAAMLEDATLARQLGARFDHVLVDEYQDTNRLQAAILRALKPDGRGLTVVGDDAQAIYGFRAAEMRNILDFAQQFEPPARVITLEHNYRSTQPILDAANAVIALAAQGFAKRLWTETAGGTRPSLTRVLDDAAQADWVADQVLRHREEGLALRAQAVLFRTAQHSAALELTLTRRSIPFVKFGGLQFLEATHVKDLLAVLRWAHNPRNRLAGWRALHLVPGIGNASATRLLDAMAATPVPPEASDDRPEDPWATDAMATLRAVDPMKALRAVDSMKALRAFVPPAAARADWPALVQLMVALQAPRPVAGEAGFEARRWPADLATAIDWYRPQLYRRHEDAAVREGDLVQLLRLAGAQGSLEAFLTELTLDPPQATSDESGVPRRDEDYLILSTIHSAKGQEWKAVYVLNVIDGCIPSDMATGQAAEIEEERRLLYVAMTRARQHLHLLAPQRFYVTQQTALGDRHLYGGVSRFIPPELQRWFERGEPNAALPSDGLAAASAPPSRDERAPGPSAPPAPAAATQIDVLALARARWSDPEAADARKVPDAQDTPDTVRGPGPAGAAAQPMGRSGETPISQRWPQNRKAT